MPHRLDEGIRAIETADGSEMRDHPGLGRPGMHLIGRRLQRERADRVRPQVEHHLMSGAGSGRGERTVPASLNRPMQMAAENAFDLGMALDDLAHGVSSGEPDYIHVVDHGAKRRMVHEQHCRAAAARGKRVRQPFQPLVAERAASLAFDQRSRPTSRTG